MKFIKLEILNLASLDRQGGETINFDEGALGGCTIFSIVGPTGSGKSTILDAICLALYKRAPRYSRKRNGNNQKIVIYGESEEKGENRLAPTDSCNILTRGKKEGYSKLTFRANNGAIYRAEWSVRKLTKDYKVVTSLFKITMENGIQVEEQAEWNELPQIIGLDYEQFLRTVLIAQGSFSSFIQAKENERYELLEKLIGCEELYTSIAAKIKEQKDEAVKAYDQIAAKFSVQEADTIPEDELNDIKARIDELDIKEKQAKAELEKVKEAIAWYATNENCLENIAKYENDLNEVRRELEAFSEQAARLALYDDIRSAIALYNEIRIAEANVEKLEKDLKSLGEEIVQKEKEIKVEEEVNLVKLKQDSRKATDELEQQKPHINAARAIKAEIEVLKKDLSEKASAKAEAEKIKNKADKDLDDNVKAIERAEAALQSSQQHLSALQKEIEEQKKLKNQTAEDARIKYNKESTRLEACDATKLQDDKVYAEKTKADLESAIRIQKDLETKRRQQKENLDQQQQLREKNNTIVELLKNFEIEKLREELETLNKLYTLMTSENWELHRAGLVEGEACPLCGATHHPYHEAEIVAPVVNNMKRLIDEKQEILKKQSDEKDKLTKEQAENDGLLKGIETNLKTLETDIANLDKEWNGIHAAHESWLVDVEALDALKPEIEQKAKEADKNLKEYNDLVKLVEQCSKEKEMAENALRKYEKISQEEKQAAEKKVTDANTLLVAEKGRNENLKEQQKEKAETLQSVTNALIKVTSEVSSKTDILKQEIGDKDPDTFEKYLEEVKKNTDNAVNAKTEAISHLYAKLKGMQGEEEATKKQKDSEYEIVNRKNEELSKWLSEYNNRKTEQLTKETIAQLCSAPDNWEEIRAKQKRIDEKITSSKTTLENEKKAYNNHQEKRPKDQKVTLLARQTELESRSNEELINLRARLQRHEAAKEQMGAIFAQKQEAESLKREWGEITDAIGGDGKTLRKIAQCYTLHFLIEHANFEIRRFNNRYELLHVKNSLGIRVIDHDRADDVRDTTSLSGGETFIVSLGLALGLSALSSRNISFENLFIDEGFGTLDPDTLATVIDALAMLQSSQGKKVGVISHTDTMSERITTQIRIIKNGNSGSSHIEIYP